MSLVYRDEYLANPNGITCRVLDVGQIDFGAAVPGRKTAETLVRRAEGGERLETKNGGKVESVYVAKSGDAIFINLFNHEDAYVPGKPDGSRLQFKDLAANGYQFTRDDPGQGGIRVKSLKTAKILHEVIREPTCLKDAWGEGHHVFLFPGATLKQDDNGHVTGIDKAAFDTTWEIASVAVPARPRSAPEKPGL